jgi:type IV pilus assembly protein PilB
MIVVAGTPREGSADLLRALLLDADRAGASAAAIESRPAGDLPGVWQAQVEPASASGVEPEGLTWAEALRGLAEQDADVVLAGQLRDPPAAAEALELALDGRMVLAGMPAEDAPLAVETLLQMRLEPWALASALRAVIPLRGARRLCDRCKKPADPSPAMLARAGLKSPEAGFAFYVPVGCGDCGQTGYAGRVRVLPVMPVGPTVARAIRARAGAETIAQAAVRDGMPPARQAVLARLRAGHVSLEDVAAVLSEPRP